MSTNYYFMVQDKEFVETYFQGEYKITDVPYFGYEIHIGKRSCGWKPLFRVHKKAYQSVKDLINFVNIHQDKIRIFDEYAREFTLEELKTELIEWADDQPVKYWKFDLRGEYDPILQMVSHFKKGTKEDHDLTSPFDHMVYDSFNAKLYPRIQCDFTHDEDGFDFMDCDFL